MKRIYSFLLCFCLLLSACSSSEPNPVSIGEPTGSHEIIGEITDDEVTEEEVIEQEIEEENEESSFYPSTEVTKGEAHENFNHIANSLTRYLLWSGEKVAIVENCPGGYEYHEYYKDYHCIDTDNRWLEFEYLDGTVTKAPKLAGDSYLWGRTSPGGSSFEWTMDEEEIYWTYLDYEEERGVKTFNMYTGEETEWMSFLSAADGLGCFSDARFIGWNDAGTHFAIVSGNEGVYPDKTRVFVLEIEEGEMVGKEKYDVAVAANCSSNNGPFYFADWYDDDTIGYYPYLEFTELYYWSDDEADMEYADGLQQDFWGPPESRDPWGNGFADYFDI